MARIPRFCAIFLFALVPSLVTSPSKAAEQPLVIEYLDQIALPDGARTAKGSCIGGLSGLAYAASSDRYFAVADDRTEARFFQLAIPVLSDGELPRFGAVEFVDAIGLKTREGEPYPDRKVDPEGIAVVSPETLLIASEGVPGLGASPFVDLVATSTGQWLGTLPLPSAFRSQLVGPSVTHGVRDNLGFEALTISPNRQEVYVGCESALAQDPIGQRAGDAFFTRLLHYHWDDVPQLVAEWRYPLTWPAGEVVAFGLAALLALDDRGRLLALERTARGNQGVSVQLFATDLAPPPAARTHVADAGSPGVLSKRLVLDFGQLGLPTENYEGMALGPQLPDGSTALVVVADNDNPRCKPASELARVRPTRLLLFRLRQ